MPHEAMALYNKYCYGKDESNARKVLRLTHSSSHYFWDLIFSKFSMPVSFYLFSHTLTPQTPWPCYVSTPHWWSHWTRMLNTSIFKHSYYIGNYMGAILYGACFLVHYSRRWENGADPLACRIWIDPLLPDFVEPFLKGKWKLCHK